MRFFQFEKYRNVSVIDNRKFNSIRAIIKELLKEVDRGSLKQLYQNLICIIEQFKSLDHDDVSYLGAICLADTSGVHYVSIIGDYQQDYLHNMLLCCEPRSIKVVFSEFINETEV